MLLKGAIEALMLIGRDEAAATLYPAIREFVTADFGVQTFTHGLTERFAGMAAAATRGGFLVSDRSVFASF